MTRPRVIVEWPLSYISVFHPSVSNTSGLIGTVKEAEVPVKSMYEYVDDEVEPEELAT